MQFYHSRKAAAVCFAAVFAAFFDSDAALRAALDAASAAFEAACEIDLVAFFVFFLIESRNPVLFL
jgi:hypothetical protein